MKISAHLTSHLSPHLSLREVVKSATAFRLGINNQPGEKALTSLQVLAGEIFEPLRATWQEPIFISSGYRSPTLNRILGGSAKSQHTKGEALDIDMDNKNSPVTNRLIFYQIKNHLVFDQLIWEYGDEENPAWVHVSYRAGKNRREVLKAVRRKGVLGYEKWA